MTSGQLLQSYPPRSSICRPEPLWCRDFRQKNPGYIEGMPCLYVGLTIHQPGDRFEQHGAGYRSSRYPPGYGVELAQDLIEGFNGEGLGDEEKEQALADGCGSRVVPCGSTEVTEYWGIYTFHSSGDGLILRARTE